MINRLQWLEFLYSKMEKQNVHFMGWDVKKSSRRKISFICHMVKYLTDNRWKCAIRFMHTHIHTRTRSRSVNKVRLQHYIMPIGLGMVAEHQQLHTHKLIHIIIIIWHQCETKREGKRLYCSYTECNKIKAYEKINK